MNAENTLLYAFRQYGDQVLRLAYCYTGNIQDAETITETVFLMLREQSVPDGEKQRFLLYHAAAEGRTLRRRGVLPELSADCAAVLHLHDHEGMELDEIGAILGESPQYLKNLLAEGREALRQEGTI